MVMSRTKTMHKQTNEQKLKKPSLRQFCGIKGETDRKYPNVYYSAVFDVEKCTQFK